jgi:hypothetical protein
MSGITRSMPGSSGPAKLTPQSTISHFLIAFRPEAVKAEVHADFANTAKRQEHNVVFFILGRSHQILLPLTSFEGTVRPSFAG